MELVNAPTPQQDEEWLVGQFEIWWVRYPFKQKKKTAQEEWIKIFTRSPGIPREGWSEYSNMLTKAIEDQLYYRKKMDQLYPNPQDKKNANVFVPRLPMPSSWLHQGRWMDDVPNIEDRTISSGHVTKCADCDNESFITVGDTPLCAWHWTKRYDRKGLVRLAETLKDMGLGPKKGENNEAWGQRCRTHLKKFQLARDLNLA